MNKFYNGKGWLGQSLWVDCIGMPTTAPTKNDNIHIVGGFKDVYIGSRIKWVARLKNYLGFKMECKNLTIHGKGKSVTNNRNMYIHGNLSMLDTADLKGLGMFTLFGAGSLISVNKNNDKSGD